MSGGTGGLQSWLQYLRLEKYYPQLNAMGHDARSLAQLDDAALTALGLPLGPRKKIRLNAGLMLQSCGRPAAAGRPVSDRPTGPSAQNAERDLTHNSERTGLPSSQPVPVGAVPAATGQQQWHTHAGGHSTCRYVGPSVRVTTDPCASSPGASLRSAPVSAPMAPSLRQHTQPRPAWPISGSLGPPRPPPPQQQQQQQQPSCAAQSGIQPEATSATTASERRPPCVTQPPAQPVCASRAEPCASGARPKTQAWLTSVAPGQHSGAASASGGKAKATTVTGATCVAPGSSMRGAAPGSKHVVPGPLGPQPPPLPPGQARCAGGAGYEKLSSNEPQPHAAAAAEVALTDGASGQAGVRTAVSSGYKPCSALAAAERSLLSRLYPSTRRAGSKSPLGGPIMLIPAAGPGSRIPTGSGIACAGDAANPSAPGARYGRVLKRSRSWDGEAWREAAGGGDGGTGDGSTGRGSSAAPQRRTTLGRHSSGGGRHSTPWRDGQALFAAAASSQPVDCSMEALMRLPPAPSCDGGGTGTGADDCVGGDADAGHRNAGETRTGVPPAGAAVPAGAAPQQPASVACGGPPSAPASLLDDPRNYETPELLAQLLYGDGAEDAGADDAATATTVLEQATQPRLSAGHRGVQPSGPVLEAACGVAPSTGTAARAQDWGHGAAVTRRDGETHGVSASGDRAAGESGGVVTREQRLARLQALREEVAATERLLATLRRMVAEEENALAAAGGGGAVLGPAGPPPAPRRPAAAAAANAGTRGGAMEGGVDDPRMPSRPVGNVPSVPSASAIDGSARAVDRGDGAECRYTDAWNGHVGGSGDSGAQTPICIDGDDGDEDDGAADPYGEEQSGPGWTLAERLELLA